MKEYNKQYKKTRIDKQKQYLSVRKHQLKTYGLSLEEYNSLLDKQQGCCAICGTHQDKFKIKLSIDHCHTSKKVRGLLCSNCNHGLGQFKDSVIFLKSAIDFLNNNA
jgi:hypothetical protein